MNDADVLWQLDACWQSPFFCENCDAQITASEGHYCAKCWKEIDREDKGDDE